MDMEQDKWIQQLHDKLAEHETAAPDDLWNDIESAISQKQQSRARIIALSRWTAAAAAVVAILVITVIGSGLFRNNDMEMDYANQEMDYANQEMELATSPVEELLADEETENASTPARHQPRERLSMKPTDETPQLALLSQPDKQANNSLQSPESPSAEVSDVAIVSDVAVVSDNTEVFDDAEVSSQPQKIITRKNQPTIHTHRIKHYPSFSLYAMNSLGEHNNSNAVFMADALARNFTNTFADDNEPAGSQENTIYLAGYEEHQHHYQPVSFGFSVAFPLNNRFSLTSGVVYTKLESEFTQTIHSQQIQQEQVLHYVGIPMGLSYRIWKYGRLRTYITAGIQADWNVSTKLSTEGVKQTMSRDRMQWSVNGSLGLQYDALPHLSLYAEPGLNYHFDNDSPVQNYFKDKPLNLKMQIGLRLELNNH